VVCSGFGPVLREGGKADPAAASSAHPGQKALDFPLERGEAVDHHTPSLQINAKVIVKKNVAESSD